MLQGTRCLVLFYIYVWLLLLLGIAVDSHLCEQPVLHVAYPSSQTEESMMLHGRDVKRSSKIRSEFAVECCTVASVRDWWDCCLRDVEATEAAGVPAGTGRLHQGWTEEPQEGIPSCSGGGEAHSERSAGDWSVPWSCRSEQRHCWVDNRYERHTDKTAV